MEIESINIPFAKLLRGKTLPRGLLGVARQRIDRFEGGRGSSGRVVVEGVPQSVGGLVQVLGHQAASILVLRSGGGGVIVTLACMRASSRSSHAYLLAGALQPFPQAVHAHRQDVVWEAAMGSRRAAFQFGLGGQARPAALLRLSLAFGRGFELGGQGEGNGTGHVGGWSLRPPNHPSIRPP